MTDITELAQRMKAAAEKATPGEWWADEVKNEGCYGSGDDCVEGFTSYAIYGSDGQTLFDSLNSDAACISEEYDGEGHVAWDETAQRNAEFIALANPANIRALVEALEKAQAKNALVASLISENAAMKGSVENAAGCINAAYAEGLIDVLAESSDERLVDLVKRRLLHAYLPVETPATDDVLVAMGDAVLLEQLEDSRKAIVSQSYIIDIQDKRNVELDSHKAALLKFISDSCYVFDGYDADISDAYVDAITSGLMPKLESVASCNPPLYWVRVKSDGGYGGPIHDSKLEDVRKKSGEWLPLTLARGGSELESRTVTAAAADVLAERQRQVTAEGWSPKHDDQYKNTELAFAASCYAFHAAAATWDLEDDGIPYDIHPVPKQWPWDPSWWKPTDARRDLVKAGALILAEIERIDRADGIKVEVE